MTAIDPLTYLDEVDATLKVACNWLSPVRSSEAVDDLVARIPALSKALRAAFEVKDGLPHWSQPDNPPGSEFDEGYEAGVLAVVRAIQAALAVNDEGGAT